MEPGTFSAASNAMLRAKSPMFEKIINYFKESKAELKKVTWPSKQQTTTHTILVISISLGVAAFFGILDYFFAMGVEKFIVK